MKQALMAIGVGGVFLAGIVVGITLSDAKKADHEIMSATSTTRPAPVAAASESAMPSPPIAGAPTSPVTPQPSGSPDAPGSENGGTHPPGPRPTAFGGEPPTAPPPIAPEALAEGERIKAELAAEGSDSGNGRVTTLVPGDFESPEERTAWEEKRKKRWEKRLQHENDIKLEEMRGRVGLQPGQEAALRRILADEFKERSRLVDTLTAREISRTSFDEAVKANVTKARQRLRNLLTPEQYTAYQKLAPREQVLRHETK